MKILIIQQRRGIGDCIIFLPYIHAISKKFNSKVSLLIKENSRAVDLLAEDEHIGEIITLSDEKDGLMGIFKLSNEIKNKKFDKVFIFNSSLRYNLIAKFAGIKSIYQYPLFRSKDNIVNSAKIFTESVIGKIVSTEANLKIKSSGDNTNKNIKKICIAIAASGPTKIWPIQNFIRLCEELSKNQKCKIYIAAGKNDIELIKKFKNSNVGENSESFEELTIKETLPIIKSCNLTIANDTGFAHISAALGVKTLTLFMDSPVLSYGRYSTRMVTIEPDGEKNSTKHDTLGKDKISFTKVLSETLKLLN